MKIEYSTIKTISAIVEKNAEKYVKEGRMINWEVTNISQNRYLDEFRSIIKNNRVNQEIELCEGNLDTFLQASCLVYSLIKHKKLHFNINDDTPLEILMYNYRLAIDVAMEFIESNRIVSYDLDIFGNCSVEKEHKNVKMRIPEGILPESIYTLLCKSLARQDYYGNKMDILEFSVILQLVYCLNCE